MLPPAWDKSAHTAPGSPASGNHDEKIFGPAHEWNQGFFVFRIDETAAVERMAVPEVFIGLHEAHRFARALNQRVAKIRRQKRKRSKRAKEKLLRNKHFRAEKKSLRGHVADVE